MKKTLMLTVMALLTMGVMAQPQQQELSAADKIQRDMYDAFTIGMGDVVSRLLELNDAFYKTENRDSVSELMKPLQKILIERQKDYMDKHPSTALAAMFLGQEKGYMTLSQLKEKYNQLDETAKQTTSAKEIAQEIATLERVGPGNPAPEIAKNDFVTGKPFSLSALKGKVVLLDFWASWCKPCRASNPHVKALFEKYHKEGFEVVYIADNDSRPADALKAIEQDGIKQYHHVLRGLKERNNDNGNFTGYDKSEDVSNLYAVHFLPTKYLIDREGKIIGKVDDETLDKKLEEIFGY